MEGKKVTIEKLTDCKEAEIMLINLKYILIMQQQQTTDVYV